MPAKTSVQIAHDDLHASGAPTANCPICIDSASTTHEKAGMEDAVSDDAKVFSEAQHFALLTSAVERETAELTGAKTELEEQLATLQSEKAALESSSTDLQNKVDVLEGEKAALNERAESAEKAFEDFKAGLAELAEVAERRTTRVEAIKAADETLPDDYFSEARVQRWAEMADADFESLVSDITEAAAAKPKGDAAEKAKDGDTAAETGDKARETAAFTGGTTATTDGSALGSFLTASGLLPGASN